ncbi:MAG: response regulator transcription factor [Ignavibacteriaceae bacterium]|nr:response regulator transcription factor [Ignavibacteriaceae bacterium]
MKKKILIAEDEQLHRFYLKRDIERERADVYEVVGEAANGLELLKLWKQLSPDIIIADLKMPVLTGGEAVKEIRRIDTTVKIIVLTSREEKFLFEALHPFVDAYLIKGKESPEGVLEKLDEVAGFSQPQIRKYLTSMFVSGGDHCSELKNKIIEKIKEGATNREIAIELSISKKYVEKLLTELFKQYDTKNRAELRIKIIEMERL